MLNRLISIAVALTAIGLPIAARANDTELTYGGTPKPLNGNTTVSMRSEYVKMVIDDEKVTVECRFDFENRGPARKVRMGFPDEGGEPDEDAGGKLLPPKGTFDRFDSWVNGRLVKTTVVRGTDYGSVWHVKRVDFPANSRLEVRDRYVVAVGSSVAYDPVSVRMARYVLHTGSSWHGLLGRSEVEVVFTGKAVRGPIMARRIPRDDDGRKFVSRADVGKRSVYYAGPGKPTVNGRTLRFVRTNWRPTKNDDILLLFDMNRRSASP